MMEWQISGQDIQAVEEILLPHGAQFPEDARNVIRCWHSTDVAACPGSGKTTVLLRKTEIVSGSNATSKTVQESVCFLIQMSPSMRSKTGFPIMRIGFLAIRTIWEQFNPSLTDL